MKKKALIAAISAVAITMALAACSGGGSGGGSSVAKNCTNKIVVKSAPVVTVWAWYPNMAKVVDNFKDRKSVV